MGIVFNPFTGNFDIVRSSGSGGAVDSVNGQTGVVQIDAVDVPFDNVASGLISTDVQAAIDELKDITDKRDLEAIYVDASEGNDTTGTGSILNPVATIQKAFTLVTNPAVGYVIRLGPGSYGGPQIEWLPNVDLIGSGANSTTVTATLNYTAAVASSTGFNMSLVTVNDLTLDFTDANVAIPNLFNGSFAITRTDTLPQGPWAVLVNDSVLGDCDFSGNFLLSNCLFVSTAVVRTAGQLLCSDVTIGIQLELEGAAAIRLTGCTVPGIINGTTIGFDTPVVQTDAGSLFGATTLNVDIILSDKAVFVDYNNSGTGLSATNVQGAINEIDNNVDDLVTLSGVGINFTDLGSFTGGVISPNLNIKEALQELGDDIAAIPEPISYQGTYDASTNTPTLDNSDTGVSGYLYQVNVAGTVDFGAGPISFDVGDKVVNNGTVWEKWDMTDSVSSVNGQTGVVSLALDNLSDVTVVGPSSGDLLSYNGSAWVNVTAPSGGANTALSNLTTTSINQDLLPDANGTRNIGSAILRWSNVFANALSHSATSYIQPFGAAIANGFTKIAWSGNDIFFQATNFHRSDTPGSSSSVVEKYVHSITLPANVVAPTTVTGILGYGVSTIRTIHIDYSIREATTNNQRGGRITIVTDGTVAAITDSYAETALVGNASGLVFSTLISGGNLFLQVNNTNATNACTMRADVKYFTA